MVKLEDKPGKPISVLQLPSWYLPEGGQFCKEQSKALQAAGLNVSILANVILPWKKYKFDAIRYPWCSFLSVEDGIQTFRHYLRRMPGWHSFNIKRWILQTEKLVDKYIILYGKPDIIHAHSSMWAGVVAAKIKKKYGIPYVLTEHQGLFGQKSNFSREQIKDAYIPLYREAFSGADYIIPVSEQQIPKIKSFLSKEVPFKVISNMIDTTFFYKKEVDRNDQKFIFFAANSYFQEKGYDILLPAFDLVCKKSDQVELRIAGRYFSKPEFQNILKNCEYSDRITFCGYLSPSGVREELWNANAFVLSSRTEAQPLSFLEALSTGKPVVCTEVVPTGTFLDFCGYRVPVEDINALATAMINMTINYQDFDKKRIAEHLRDLASPDVVAWEIYHIYTEILHSKNH